MYALLILSNTYENYYIQNEYHILLKNNCNCHFVTEKLQERVFEGFFQRVPLLAIRENAGVCFLYSVCGLMLRNVKE